MKSNLFTALLYICIIYKKKAFQQQQQPPAFFIIKITCPFEGGGRGKT